MKEELRAYDQITNAITAYAEKRISSVDIVKIINYILKNINVF